MAIPRPNLEFVKLQRLQKVKQSTPAGAGKLGGELVQFFKQSVQKRQTKLGKIAEAWQQAIEEGLCEHCSLESLHRGTLTVIVDSSAHLYQLKQVLLSGVEKRLVADCKSTGLRKVVLRPGRWYAGEDGRARTPTFE